MIGSAPMPPGYSLEVTPQRKYKYRTLWNVRVFRDGPNGELERVYGRAVYNIAAGIRMAQRWAWDRVPLTVTTDADGWITSMEPTDA